VNVKQLRVQFSRPLKHVTVVSDSGCSVEAPYGNEHRGTKEEESIEDKQKNLAPAANLIAWLGLKLVSRAFSLSCAAVGRSC